MTWEKRGIIIPPPQWSRTHCMLPAPLFLGGDAYRIFYGTRNEQNQSCVGYADIDLNTLEVTQCSGSVLGRGPLGTFSDNGVLPSCAFREKLYYIGFKPGGTTRMQLLTGVATKKGDVYGADSSQPLLNNHIGIATALWRCGELAYYVHGIEWVDKDTPRYDIRVIQTVGNEYKISTAIALEDGENALARPYVLRTESGYEMWFSAKGETYRPRYATSDDGITWGRKPYEFPEEEMAYPIMIRHNGKEFILYNDSSDYGARGIRMAVRKYG